MTNIAIGADHAGYKLKEKIKTYLEGLRYSVIDFGTMSEESVDYPEFGVKVAEAVSNGSCKYGILICGTGIGMSITANRLPGIRAALCNTQEVARLCREHNDANILVMGARVIESQEVIEIVNTFLNTRFAGGRHERRIEKIEQNITYEVVRDKYRKEVYVERLYDNVFGYIYLTEPEWTIINTPLFQRLHHIRQLGLMSIVFPGATHTRYSHSLGVLYIMGRLIEHLESKGLVFTPDERAALRMAALLHDIGHFPLSHVGERAVERAFKEKEKRVIEKSKKVREGQVEQRTKLHEKLSADIVLKWKKIRELLERFEIDPKLVADIIEGNSELHHTTLLHSELDADRLDYLLRDSFFTGVNYGQIELDHIISKLEYRDTQEGKIIGVTARNIHSVEHYLLARYFMYVQIVYHPQIVLLEDILEEILTFMIRCKDIPELKDYRLYSKEELIEYIEENNEHAIYDYNDHFVLYRMRELHNKFNNSDKLTAKYEFFNDIIKMILSGQISKPCIFKKQIISRRDRDSKVYAFKKICNEKREIIADEIGVDINWIRFSDRFASVSKLRFGYSPGNAPNKYERDEAVKIIDDNSSRFLVECPDSIIGKLADDGLQIFYGFTNIMKVDEDKAKKVFEMHVDMRLLS